MALDEEAGHRRELLWLHRPQSVLTARSRKKTARGPMLLELSADLVRHKIRLADEGAERLGRRLPVVHAVYLPAVRDRDNNLHRHMTEPTLIGAGDQPRDCPDAPRLLAEQILFVLSEEVPQELALAVGLLDRGREAVVVPAVPTRPLIAPGTVVSHGDRVGHRFALDDECPPAMQHKVIDLTDTVFAVGLPLVRIDEPEIVEHEQTGVGRECPVEIERQPLFRLITGTNPRIRRPTFRYRLLDDHAGLLIDGFGSHYPGRVNTSTGRMVVSLAGTLDNPRAVCRQ